MSALSCLRKMGKGSLIGSGTFLIEASHASGVLFFAIVIFFSMKPHFSYPGVFGGPIFSVECGGSMVRVLVLPSVMMLLVEEPLGNRVDGGCASIVTC